jgi:mRNA interferase MazF
VTTDLPAAGSIVLVRFPFSDLTAQKIRPALVMADAGRGDWVLSQITSKAYGDTHAVALTEGDFATGGLKLDSFARPTKLFTAHTSLMAGAIGRLQPVAHQKVVESLVAILRGTSA